MARRPDTHKPPTRAAAGDTTVAKAAKAATVADATSADTAMTTEAAHPAEAASSLVERQQAMLREVTTTLLVTLVLFLGLRYSAQAVPLDGPSMQPGLHTNERVLVNSLAYAFSGPQRGDVIVLHPPSALGERYIKRVIGTPGDTITLTANSVAVNGVTLNEPYIAPIPLGETENPEPARITLGPDQYFVMGDNRANSQDSRYFGPITRADIIGKAEFVVWPMSSAHEIDTYATVFEDVPAPPSSGAHP